MPAILNAEPECSGGGTSTAVCDYEPFCIDAAAADPDTVILGLAPFAYYPMDDASGLIQDTSGNGNHASATTGAGTITYAQPALTTKVGASIAFDGGGFLVPKPDSDSGSIVGDLADWTMIWLERISAVVGTGSPAQPSMLMGQSGAAAAALLVGTDAGAGLRAVISNRTMTVDDVLPLNQTVCIALTKKASPSTDLLVEVNGVGWILAGAVTTGNDALAVGKSADGFWGHATHRMSNLAAWSSPLTYAQRLSVVRALLGAADLAAGFVP